LNSTQQAQPEAASPSTPDQGAEQPTRLYAGKYKTLDELEKSAIEKDSHIVSVETENRLLREQLKAGKATEQTQEPDLDEKFNAMLDQNFDKEQQKILKAMTSIVVDRSTKPLREELETIRKERMFDSIKTEFPDYNDPNVVRAVQQIIDSNPNLTLKQAYTLTYAEKNKQELNKLRTGVNVDDRRKMAYVDGGGTNVPLKPEKEEEAWLEEFLPKRKRESRV
jgi:hypothetical protein